MARVKEGERCTGGYSRGKGKRERRMVWEIIPVDRVKE